MSRDVFPTQIQVPVFFMIRLCANAEIGVPREELPCFGTTPVRTSIFTLPVIPASPRHSCSSPRHSCEGRNLNQDIVVLTYTSP